MSQVRRWRLTAGRPFPALRTRSTGTPRLDTFRSASEALKMQPITWLIRHSTQIHPQYFAGRRHLVASRPVYQDSVIRDPVPVCEFNDSHAKGYGVSKWAGSSAAFDRGVAACGWVPLGVR